MKILIACLAACVAASAAPPPLKPGDAVKPDAVATAEFLQGGMPKTWEKGRVYLIECWATWCAPCVELIPQLNRLHDEFSPKGLRVIGMNVWEDDPAAVEDFVVTKGQDMTYPVAFAGMKGDFVKTWLEPAGIRALPYTFLVRDGVWLCGTHPSQLTREVVADLLEGGPKADAFIKQQRAEAARAARVAEANSRINGFARERKHKDALKVVETLLATPAGLTKADIQRFTITKAMILAELKQYDASLKTLDKAAAIQADSPVTREIDDLKKAVAARKSETKEIPPAPKKTAPRSKR